MKILICLMLAMLLLGCMAQGHPIFRVPSWRNSTTPSGDIYFKSDDEYCRNVYRQSRQDGKSDSEAFSDRVRCMQDKGYEYMGRN